MLSGDRNQGTGTNQVESGAVCQSTRTLMTRGNSEFGGNMAR